MNDAQREERAIVQADYQVTRNAGHYVVRPRAALLPGMHLQSHRPHSTRPGRPHSMGPAVQAIHDDERDTGYTWQQRGPLTVACAA